MHVFLTLSADQRPSPPRPAPPRRPATTGSPPASTCSSTARTPTRFVALAAAAGATTRIRLLSSLTVLPLYPAALAAKLATTLDQVSGGRFDLGVGVGGEYPPEFVAAGVDVAQRGARTDEALELLRALWPAARSTSTAGSPGVPGLAPLPRPVQPGGPPLWLGGRRPAASVARGGSPTSGCRTCTRPSSWPRASARSARPPSGQAGTRRPSAARSSAGAGSTPIPTGPDGRSSPASARSTSRTSRRWPTGTCCTATPTGCRPGPRVRRRRRRDPRLLPRRPRRPPAGDRRPVHVGRAAADPAAP